MKSKQVTQEAIEAVQEASGHSVYGGSSLPDDDYSNEAAKKMAKEYAQIAVDEILSMGIMSESGDWRMAKSYWEEVKEEIQNL